MLKKESYGNRVQWYVGELYIMDILNNRKTIFLLRLQEKQDGKKVGKIVITPKTATKTTKEQQMIDRTLQTHTTQILLLSF